MTLSCGIAMEIHYCMGSKAGIDFYGATKDTCSKCGMKEKKGCCHDEYKFYKIEDAYKNVSNNISFATPEAEIISTNSLYDWQITSTDVVTAYTINDPPVYTGPSACIMYCVFRI
ncbi:MAG: hypothetical protein WCG67_02835 [Ferruginibacter sp.]